MVLAARGVRMVRPEHLFASGRRAFEEGPCGCEIALIAQQPPEVVEAVWYSPTYHNQRVATAGPHSHVNFSWGTSTTLSPGRIVVTACEHFNGWHCGAGVHV